MPAYPLRTTLFAEVGKEAQNGAVIYFPEQRRAAVS